MTALSFRPSWSDQEGSDRVTGLFQSTFAVDPSGVWFAPGRVNLIGEHTDYNGGLCLPIALPHRTFAAVTKRDDDTVRLVSAQQAEPVEHLLGEVVPGTVSGWTGYVVGVAWALREAGYQVSGFDVAIDSCVPFGAGLSSSAAIECATAVALDDLFNLGLGETAEGRKILAAACIRAENEIAGANTGGMDQSISLLGTDSHALLLDTLDFSLTQIPFDLSGDGLSLLVIDTKAPHALVDGQYAERRASCEAAAEMLEVDYLRRITDLDDALAKLGAHENSELLQRRVRHVVTEIRRVTEFVDLLGSGYVEAVGPLMNASHKSLRFDYEVSCPELDTAVTTAREAGALGARMTGGGFGGSAIALVRTSEMEAVAQAVADAFEHAGHGAPEFLISSAAAGAGRIR